MHCATCRQRLPRHHPLDHPCPSCRGAVLIGDRVLLREPSGRHSWLGVDLLAGHRVVAAPRDVPAVPHAVFPEIRTVAGWGIQPWVDAPPLTHPSEADVADVLAAIDDLHDAGLCHGRLTPDRIRQGPRVLGIPRFGKADDDLAALARWIGSRRPEAALRRVVGALEDGADAIEALASLRFADPLTVDTPEDFGAPLVHAPADDPPPRWRRPLRRGIALAIPVVVAAIALILRPPLVMDYTSEASVPAGLRAEAARYQTDPQLENCLVGHPAGRRRSAPALLTVERSDTWRRGRYQVRATDPLLAACLMGEARQIDIPEGDFRMAIPLSLR